MIFILVMGEKVTEKVDLDMNVPLLLFPKHFLLAMSKTE